MYHRFTLPVVLLLVAGCRPAPSTVPIVKGETSPTTLPIYPSQMPIHPWQNIAPEREP